MQKCLQCQSLTSNPKFCNRSCAASFNNIGTQRHGRSPTPCLVCGGITPLINKFCGKVCQSNARSEGITEEHKRKLNALRQSRYRAKKYRVLAENADHAKIKEIYLNCPDGHEVDHITPLSLGGLHHEDNLQYLPWRVNRSKGNRYIG